MAEDPRSLTERLTDASMEAKQTLQDLHIAAKDLRALIREYDHLVRDAKNQISDVKVQFRTELDQALAHSEPMFRESLGILLDKHNKQLEKTSATIIGEVSAHVERRTKELNTATGEVMADLKRTMDVSRTARELSEKASDVMVEHSKKAQEMAVAIVGLLDKLAQHFAGGNVVDLQIEKDEDTGQTKIITLHKKDPTDPNDPDLILHLEDKPEEA